MEYWLLEYWLFLVPYLLISWIVSAVCFSLYRSTRGRRHEVAAHHFLHEEV